MRERAPDRGTIPYEALKPHVDRWLVEFEEDHGDEGVSATFALACRMGDKVKGKDGKRTVKPYDVEGLRKIIKGQWVRLEFNTADRLICAMGDASLWYELGEPVERVPDNEFGFVFRDMYWKVDLTKGHHGLSAVRKCERKGCSETFLPNARGGRKQRFCSKRCQMVAYERRHGRKDRGNSPYRSLESKKYDTCPSGHDRSEANTGSYVNKKGIPCIYCRVCQREKARARRAKP